MPSKRLTEKGIERTKVPTAGRVEYWDTTQPGLLLRITDRGRKTWNLLYRFGGRKKRLGLGGYPAINLKKARAEAGKALQKVDAGEDPAEERKARKAPEINTVAAAVEDFDERHLKSLRSGRQAKATLDNELVKRYGDTKLTALKRYHVQNMIDEIIERGAPVKANRTLAWTRRLLNWCVSRGLLEYNITQGIERTKERPRDRVLSDKEVLAVWTAAETDNSTFGDLVKLLLLTGQRLSECARMQWADVDDDGVWTLSSEQTKAGRVHEVPLPAAALAIIEQRPQIVDNPYAFAGRGNVAINGFSKPKARLNKLIAKRAKNNEAPNADPWTLHDLRRTCATNIARLGFSDEVIGAVLNHAPKGVTARHYQHYRSLPAKREALNAWADRVETIIQGTDKVVPIREAQ